MDGGRLILAMCAAQAAAVIGLSTFPALLPGFIESWALSGTDAGLLNSAFFVGYVGAVPFLVGLTDRIDARIVFVWGAVVVALSLAAFALLADGFWSALWLRTAAGVGFAGTYMPGLKALTDRLSRGEPSRAVALYTACSGFGTSLGFYMAGEIGALAGWRWSFAAAACGGLAALALALAALRPLPPAATGARWLPDFRAVFRNRRAMAYIYAYGLHSSEWFVMTSWTVTFLAFALALRPGEGGLLAPTVVGAAITLIALPASLGGNELSLRLGRRQTVAAVMLATGALACGLGFAAVLPYLAVAALCLLFGAMTAGDSASITAGTHMAAASETRGATLALHSLFGFGGGIVGPFVFGAVLDLSGGPDEIASWGFAFAAIGVSTLLGPLLLYRMMAAEPVKGAR